MQSQLPVVARLDLSECPVGVVFRNADPDQRIERTLFADWHNAAAHPPHLPSWRQFCVISEDFTGRKLLENTNKHVGCLLTGTAWWRDYTIQLVVRQLLDTTLPTDDDEFTLVARTGIAFRHQTVRRHYHFCMEGFRRFVLYRRKDDVFTELGAWDQAIDRSQFYTLAVRLEGSRIQCSVDGKVVIEVQDDAYPRGPAGLRTTTLSRIESITVAMDESAQRDARDAEAAHQRETQRRRSDWPAMKLWRELKVGEAQIIETVRPPDAPPFFLLGTKLDTKGWLFGQAKAPAHAWLRAVDLEGRTLWQRDLPHPLSLGPAVGELRRGAGPELACVIGSEIHLIDLRTGQTRRSRPLPPPGPFFLGRKTLFRGATCSPGKIYILQLQPPPAPKSFLLTEDSSGGGYGLWAYDHELNELWSLAPNSPPYGHVLDSYDIDNDGCDEIVAGYAMVDHDGRLMWRVEGCEYFDCFLGGRHPDVVHIGKLDGREVSIAIAGGPDGAVFVDARNGKVKARPRIGHAQTVAVGNFRPERAGQQEVFIFNAWGNFAITTLFSATGEELMQFQPCRFIGGFQPVRNWRGDGQDLLYLASNERLLGLWDGEGHQVVEMPAPFDEPRDPFKFPNDFPQVLVTDVRGDGRDQMLIVEGETLRIYAPSV